MTLGQFFDHISANPRLLLFYLIALPLISFLACVFGKHEGHLKPWTYLYSGLIYLTCIPGLFAIILNLYLFLFENQSIMNMNLYTQVLPIISMVVTLIFIRSNVSLKRVKGFNKLSGLMTAVFGLMLLMWILEKTRLVAFTYLPFQYVALIFVGILVLIRYGTRQITSKD